MPCSLFAGDGVKQVDLSIFLKNCRIAQLVDRFHAGTGLRRPRGKDRAFPGLLGTVNFVGRAEAPVLPVRRDIEFR
jgi:hypothetical protein